MLMSPCIWSGCAWKTGSIEETSKAYSILALEDGTVLEGESFVASGEKAA